MTLDIIIQKWAGRNVFYILTQAAGHGGMSRIPGGGGGGREPCVTCIRIELGETICPDGEFSLARPLWCTACTTLTLTLEHYTRVRFNCNFIFQPFTVWRMRTSRRLGKSWKRKYLLALKNSHSRCRLNWTEPNWTDWCLGICESCGQTPPSLQWMYPEGSCQSVVSLSVELSVQCCLQDLQDPPDGRLGWGGGRGGWERWEAPVLTDRCPYLTISPTTHPEGELSWRVEGPHLTITLPCSRLSMEVELGWGVSPARLDRASLSYSYR